MKKRHDVHVSEYGAVLSISLMFMAILSLLGGTAMVLSRTDLQIGKNHRSNAQAFYDAEAGLNYTLAKIEDGLENGTVSLPSNGSSTVAFPQPSGFSFTISEITKTSPTTWLFNSTGYAPNNSKTVLKVIFSRKNAISFAAFGDTKLDTKSSGSTLSYDSSSADPTVNDPTHPSFNSTHKADVGSNDWLVTHNGASIDGDGVFGEQDDGSATKDGLNKWTTFYGTAPVHAGRINPDPLGVRQTGSKYNPMSYSNSTQNYNSNSTYDPDDVVNDLSNNINLTNNATLIGIPGETNFYLNNVILNPGSNLTINATNGTVNFFLTGTFDAKSGSTINIKKNGSQSYDSSAFSIFSRSSSKIDLKHSSDFIGLIYAPYAPIDVKNSANVYGAIWGDNVDIKNSGTVYFDTNLKNKHLSNDLILTSWSDER